MGRAKRATGLSEEGKLQTSLGFDIFASATLDRLGLSPGGRHDCEREGRERRCIWCRNPTTLAGAAMWARHFLSVPQIAPSDWPGARSLNWPPPIKFNPGIPVHDTHIYTPDPLPSDQTFAKLVPLQWAVGLSSSSSPMSMCKMCSCPGCPLENLRLSIAIRHMGLGPSQ